jgi:Protein of unknown function (DUF3987)
MKTPPTTDAMFPGLVGDLVAASVAATEADAACVAAHFLVAFGAVVGRGPHVLVGETVHHVNENCLIVGSTSAGGKGDGGNVGLMPILDAAQPWRPRSGLSSGEGLIHACRDAVYGLSQKGERVLRDEGVDDKRLLILETEFSAVLKQFRREHNILSNVLRDAWDGKALLTTLTKNSPTCATNAHVSIIGHTTPEDLRAYLSDLDAANGTGNRFLFVAVRRCRTIPDPPPIPRQVREPLVHAVASVLAHAGTVDLLMRTPAAAAAWSALYPTLRQDRPGLLGALLARGPAHVARLSALFALCAGARAVDVPHLEAAAAWWRYATASAEVIFANRTGLDAADRIRAEMLPDQELDLRTMRQELFNNHISAGRLREALDLLTRLEVVRLEERKTDGRPRCVVIRLRTDTDATEAA